MIPLDNVDDDENDDHGVVVGLAAFKIAMGYRIPCAATSRMCYVQQYYDCNVVYLRERCLKYMVIHRCGFDGRRQRRC